MDDVDCLCLVPDNCTDDVAALEHFSRMFNMRYHSTGPLLFLGSLDGAIQEALHASIYDVNFFSIFNYILFSFYQRRPLAIYLHNDHSVCANVFCSQILAADSMIEYLANNYVFWAWDVTSNNNKTR